MQDLRNNFVQHTLYEVIRGLPIGSCGPTSSYRMDDLLEVTLKMGISATIGKGERKPFVKELAKRFQVPYLLTVGGAGAYLAECA